MTFCILPDRALLRLAGAQAQSFLHRLVSANVASLEVGQATFSALLSPQGKILYDFFVLRQAEEVFLLETHAVCLQGLMAKLTVYKLSTPLTIEPWLGTVGVVFNQEALEMAGDAIKFQDPRWSDLGWRLWFDPGTPLPESANPQLWRQHRLRLGVGEVGSEWEPGTVFPLHVNLDLLGGIDFKKGCFVGQEVTTRMARRNMVRKRFLPCMGEGDIELKEVILPPWIPFLHGGTHHSK